MNCEAVLELVAADRADGDTAVAAHLEVCPQCRVRVPAAETLGRHLRDPLLWEEPPEHLAEAIVEEVAGESQARPPRRRWWFLGIAAVLALVVLGLAQLTGRPDWQVDLRGGPAAPGAAATVSGWNLEEGTKMVLEISGLEPAPRDSYYELWLTAPDGRHVSAGTFVNAGRVEVTAGVRRSEFPRLWITREPADNDPAPFPETVLDTPPA